MTFFRITKAHPFLASIQTWYEASFPSDERRRFDEVIALLPYPDMHVCALVNGRQLIGFIIYWQWEEIMFVEHFAIDPAQRGQQFGQQALAHLLTIDCAYLILEVERPVDEISRRRIRFYERQGFWLNTFDYSQPPYQPGKAAVPMRLMSIPALADQKAFVQYSALIKERVYDRFYRHS